jgi:hypothetical protein
MNNRFPNTVVESSKMVDSSNQASTQVASADEASDVETTKIFKFRKDLSNQEIVLIAIVDMLERIDRTLKGMALKLS